MVPMMGAFGLYKKEEGEPNFRLPGESLFCAEL